MPAQPVDVCRDCPLDSVLGAISHFFSDTGVVHVGAGPVLWAVSRLQLDLHTRDQIGVALILNFGMLALRIGPRQILS